MTDAALIAISIVHMIARIIVGECGGTVPEAGPAIARVAMNRLDAGKGYDGWHAIADEPEPWALDVAWEAYWKGGDANGDVFAISGVDMVKLGFDETNWENVGSIEWPVYIGEVWQ